MADSPRKFQAPKGTRDFYPADLAVRRHIENVWRQTSINHGFDEIDGPMFEHLDLYTHKSGPGIASELFQVFSGKDPEQVAAIRAGGAAPLALRPEFTPTLARMVAAKAPELPRPIKWFAIPNHFRAESPQRGRLREFMQWNVDFIGDDSPRADAEVIATAVRAMQRLGLGPTHVRVRISHRGAIERVLLHYGLPATNISSAFAAIDAIEKVGIDESRQRMHSLGMPPDRWDEFREFVSLDASASEAPIGFSPRPQDQGFSPQTLGLVELESLHSELANIGLLEWCRYTPSLARGLAYYTGTVFEIHEASGAERAIAGGGRYDKLIESFGGPSLPACGFGMGDVVLANVLADKGLLEPAETYLPRPDAFVFAITDPAAEHLPSILSKLRSRGDVGQPYLHIRNTYKTTRNVGKLLGDAGKARARYAVILGSEMADTPPKAIVKDLDAGVQDPQPVPIDELAIRLRRPNVDG